MKVDRLPSALDGAQALSEVPADRPQAEAEVEAVDPEFSPESLFADNVLRARACAVAPRTKRYGEAVRWLETCAAAAPFVVGPRNSNMGCLRGARAPATDTGQQADKSEVLPAQPEFRLADMLAGAAGDSRRNTAHLASSG